MPKNKNKAPEYDREDDGQLYVAISTKARTRAGRLLAAGAHLPFQHRHYGQFNSLAGLIRFLRGDRRDISHTISGADYDSEIVDVVPEQYEEVLIERVHQILRTTDGLSHDLHRFHSQPKLAYHELDGEMIFSGPLPNWFKEAIGLKTPVMAWDPTAIERDFENVWVAPPRSLLQLQVAYLEAQQGTDEAIDFLVSQEEYDSIPEDVRKLMGDALKIQRAFEGTSIPAPPKKIM